MRTLAIVNQKGGVGKTTTAVTLAHGLVHLHKRVLLVDLDAQGDCADALGIGKKGSLHAFVAQKAGRKAVSTTGRRGLDVVTSDKSTVQLKSELIGMMFREKRLAQALETVAGGYDVCVLDVAPGVDILQVGALIACTHFIIPVALSKLAVVGAGDALASTAALKQAGEFRGQFLGVLPTFWDQRVKENTYQLKTLAAQFKELVWPPIPVDAKAGEAPSYGQTLWEYAPKCRALQGSSYKGKVVGGYCAVLRRLVGVLDG